MILITGQYRFFEYTDPWGLPAKEFVFDIEQYVFVHVTGEYKYHDGYGERDAKILSDANGNNFYQIFNVGDPVGYHDENKKWWYTNQWRNQRYVKNGRPFLFHHQIK